MDIDKLTIGEAKQLAALFGGAAAATREKGHRIVVLQRGHVVVGDYERNGDSVVIRNASVVRRWGTTKGLGELASKGPLLNTILDPCGEWHCHWLTVVGSIPTEPGKW